MSQIYRVIVMPQAFVDLDKITDYIEQTSPQNAAKVLDLLSTATGTLDRFPQRYKTHEHRLVPEKTVHSMPVPPFIAYYRIDEINHVVRILTVRHGARRQPRRFK